MTTVSFRKLKLTYALMGVLWTLVVLGSLAINGNSAGDNVFLRSLASHVVVWVTASLAIAFNFRQMTTAISFRDKLARDLKHAVGSTESLIDAVPFGIVIIGKDKIIRKANQEAGRILGREPGDVVGNVCHRNICPAEVGHCPILDLHQVVDRSDKLAMGANGAEIPVHKSVIPFNWHGEDVLLEAFVDVSERKKHEADMVHNLADLQKFNRLATGRELKMIELKAEINALLKKQGKPERYKIVAMDSTEEIVTAGELS